MDTATLRRQEAAEAMFPDVAPHLRGLAYAWIDEGLCFYTCPPDCRGKCIEVAESAVGGIPVLDPEGDGEPVDNVPASAG